MHACRDGSARDAPHTEVIQDYGGTQLKTATIFSAAVALALGLFGWFNTAGYRASVQAYQVAAAAHLQQLKEQLQQDEGRYQRCDAMRAENKTTNTIDFTPEGRACLMDALVRVSSVEGALVLARNASVALARNPQDRQLREAALGSIERARMLLASHKPWLHDRLEQINQAHAHSLVLRMFVAPPASQLNFASQAALLDQAEYAIHLPGLHQNQQIWRLEALLPKAGPVERAGARG